MKQRLAFVLATWFGCGLSPVAPGTVGTLAALPLYYTVRGAGPLAVLALGILVAAIGVWAAGKVVDASGHHDPQIVVADEVAGVIVALAAAPPTFAGVACAVVLFRLFDITKPWPARAAERLPRGWGVVVDDLVAGAWGAACLFVLRALEVLS